MADRVVVMQEGPGRVVSELHVLLAHRRQRKAPEFLVMVDRVYARLAGQTESEQIELGSAPCEPGRTRPLPHRTITDLAGLLRKEICAARVRRLPMFRWLLTMLQASHEKRLERSAAEAALALEFPSEEAHRQLETIVNWGRYTELLAYDDTRDYFDLEPAGAAPTIRGNGGTAAQDR